MKNFRILLYFILFVFSGIISCRKTINPSWEVSLYTPLLKSTLDFNKILADSLLQNNADQSLSLVYRYFFYDFSLDNLLNIPDTLTQKYLPPLGGLTLSPGQTFFNFTEHSKLKIPTAQVSRVDMHEGKLVLEVNSSITEKIIVTYKIPNAKKDGVSFQVTETVPAATSGETLHFEKIYDISGYSIDLRGPDGLGYNILSNVIKATLDPNGNPYTLQSDDVFNFNVRFKDLSLQYAKGYFGSSDYVFGPDTSKVNIFSNVLSGQVLLEDIKLFLNIENRFGIDAQVIFDKFVSINSSTGHAEALDDPIIGQTINISRATESFNPLSPVHPARYSYNLSNSNIRKLVENIPDAIEYKIRVKTNPLGNISAGNDFVYYGNYLNASLDMEIPLSFFAKDFVLGDTVQINISGEPQGLPQSGLLKLIADNGFPFSAEIQFYVINAQNQVIDSILVPSMISAPPLNAEYMVTSPKRTEIYIPVSTERLISFLNAKKVFIKATFNTAGAPHYIKIYNFYKLDMKLTGDFNYIIDL